MIWRGALVLVFWAGQITASPLAFPSNAKLTGQHTGETGTHGLIVGPWDDGLLPKAEIKGELTQQAWQFSAAGLTNIQVLRPLREQLRNDGFEFVFECDTDACGGFDFRFALDVLAPPDMYVNLGDFYFAAARKTNTDGQEEGISLLISRTSLASYVQVTRIGPPLNEGLATATAPSLRPQGSVGSLADQLETRGHAILAGLEFKTGSSQLAEGEFPSLQELADYIGDNPNLRIALVGHTDAEGSLEGNIALSKRRAASVLERLATDYDVDRQVMEAEGMGYLSPVSNNLTEEGRQANRRVEVIVLSD